MPTRLLLFTLACFILLGTMFMFSKLNADIYDIEYKLTLSDKVLSLIVSDTPELREIGLSRMDSLSKNKAMLFKFPELGEYGIWMKDMKFPIDIIWLDEDKRIVKIEHNISPDTYPRIFSSRENSLYIIEMNSGFAKENNIEVGDVLNFNGN